MNRSAKRKCEMWISNNKVLVGGSKKPHARNPNFETEETKLLISLWGDPQVQKTLITTHKKHPVIMKLADKMREHGYYRSAEEINTRIKNLKCFYNRIKKDLELGVIQEPTWKHYGAMAEIINRPVFGNRVQQPHLMNQQQKLTALAAGTDIASVKTDRMVEEEDSNELRPEDLLSVEEEGEEETEMDVEDGSLIPKEEPVDIDDMEEPEEQTDIDDVNDIFPKLSEYLQLASNANQMTKPPISPSNIKQSPPSSPTPSEMKIVHSIATSTPPPSATSTPPPLPPQMPSQMSAVTHLSSTMVTQQPTATTAQNKISLVPTNILMKSHQQSSISFNPTSLFCAKSGTGTQSVYTSSTGNMPMKVLLVNALPKPAAPVCVSAAATVAAASAQGSSIMLPKKTLTATMKAPVTRSTTAAATLLGKKASQSTPETSASNGDARQSGPTWKYQKGTPGFRSLLHQLVQVQVETLTVTKQRLEIEKKRMEYQQMTDDKLTNILQILSSKKEKE